MVHALRRAHDLVKASGGVIDLHPTEDPAVILVGDAVAGAVDTGGAKGRHRAATQAIAAAAREGLFAIEDANEFDFFAYADSIEELQQHIVDDWREGRIGDATMAAARRLLRTAPGVKPRVRERVVITRLRPL